MGRSKKKIDAELKSYFPEYYSDDLEFIEKMRQLTLFKIEESQGDEKAGELLKEIYEFFIRIQKPKVFNPYDGRSVIIEADLEHENICNSLEENGFVSVKNATVFEFLSKIRYMEKRAQKIKEYGTGK